MIEPDPDRDWPPDGQEHGGNFLGSLLIVALVVLLFLAMTGRL